MSNSHCTIHEIHESTRCRCHKSVPSNIQFVLLFVKLQVCNLSNRNFAICKFPRSDHLQPTTFVQLTLGILVIKSIKLSNFPIDRLKPCTFFESLAKMPSKIDFSWHSKIGLSRIIPISDSHLKSFFDVVIFPNSCWSRSNANAAKFGFHLIYFYNRDVFNPNFFPKLGWAGSSQFFFTNWGWAGSTRFFQKIGVELAQRNVFWKNRVEPAQPILFSPRSVFAKFFFRVERFSSERWLNPKKKNFFLKKGCGTVRMDYGWLQDAHGGCGATAPLLAARPEYATCSQCQNVEESRI